MDMSNFCPFSLLCLYFKFFSEMSTSEAFLDNNDNESEKAFELLEFTACFIEGKIFEVLFMVERKFYEICLEIYRICDF